MNLLLAFLGGAIFCAGCLLFLWRQRVQLEASQAALVIRSGNPSRIVFGDFVLMPFFERMERISLQEQVHSFSFSNQESFHSLNGQKLNIDVEIRILPPKDRKRLKQLLDEKGLEVFANLEGMNAVLVPIVQKTLIEIIAQREAQAWINQYRGELEEGLQKYLIQSSIGFEVLSVVVSKIRSTDLEFYDSEKLEDKKGLLSYHEEMESLEEIERARDVVASTKKSLGVERKELQRLQFEVQEESQRLDTEHQRFRSHLNHIRQEIRVQIDLLKSHLDVELSEYRRQAAQESALLGKTSPPSVERETTKLRNRHRIDADMLKRKHEEKVDQIADSVESTIPKEE